MTFVGRAAFVRAHEGRFVSALGSEYRYKVVGRDTEGAYSLVEETLHESPPLHMHDHDDEAFYVLDGHGVCVVGDRHQELAAGDFVLVPRGVAHTLAPHPGTTLRMLTIVSPAGFEQFFVEVERREAESGPMSDDEIVELAATFGTQIIGPPLELA